MTRERGGSSGEDYKFGAVTVVPLFMAMHRCATRNVGKPAYKDKAYSGPFKAGFASKHECIAGKTFFFTGNISRLTSKYGGRRAIFNIFL